MNIWISPRSFVEHPHLFQLYHLSFPHGRFDLSRWKMEEGSSQRLAIDPCRSILLIPSPSERRGRRPSPEWRWKGWYIYCLQLLLLFNPWLKTTNKSKALLHLAYLYSWILHGEGNSFQATLEDYLGLFCWRPRWGLQTPKNQFNFMNDDHPPTVPQTQHTHTHTITYQ